MKLFAAVIALILVFGCTNVPKNSETQNMSFDEFSLYLSAGTVIVDLPDGRQIKGSATIFKDGFVLTVAHLVEEIPLGATVNVKHGNSSFQGILQAKGIKTDVDLALIKISEIEGSPVFQNIKAQKLCEKNLQASQPVIAMVHENAVNTFGSPDQLHQWYYKDFTGSKAITAFLDHGSSGGGVFDAKTGCLLGVIHIQSRQELKAGGLDSSYTVSFYGTVLMGLDDINKFLKKTGMVVN